MNVGFTSALAPPLPVMSTVGLYMPAASPELGRTVKALAWPGAIAVAQLAPGTSDQFWTDGSEFKVTFCVPEFVTVTVCAAGCTYPTGRLPKFGAGGDTEIA